jgi:DNA-binding GntR family transcriptional regulator
MRDKRPLSSRLHDWLRQAILDVRLLPGAPIAESEIAARFGSSRTPVREALLRLAEEDLVEVLPQRGTYVATLSLSRIEEALFVREAIECAVIRQVAARQGRADLARRLEVAIREHAAADAAGDVAAVMAADTQFHRTLVEASGLPGIWTAVARAREMDQRIRAIAVPELRSGAQAIRAHRAIVAALRAGRAADAVAGMTAHIERNLELARTLAEHHPDYFAPAGGAR